MALVLGMWDALLCPFRGVLHLMLCIRRGPDAASSLRKHYTRGRVVFWCSWTAIMHPSQNQPWTFNSSTVKKGFRDMLAPSSLSLQDQLHH